MCCIFSTIIDIGQVIGQPVHTSQAHPNSQCQVFQMLTSWTHSWIWICAWSLQRSVVVKVPHLQAIHLPLICGVGSTCQRLWIGGNYTTWTWLQLPPDQLSDVQFTPFGCITPFVKILVKIMKRSTTIFLSSVTSPQRLWKILPCCRLWPLVQGGKPLKEATSDIPVIGIGIACHDSIIAIHG